MSWNYRLIHQQFPFVLDGKPSKEDHYAIHEVYYDDEGVPNGVSAKEIAIHGETVDEAWACQTMMVEAFNRPILDMDQFAAQELKWPKQR